MRLRCTTKRTTARFTSVLQYLKLNYYVVRRRSRRIRVNRVFPPKKKHNFVVGFFYWRTKRLVSLTVAILPEIIKPYSKRKLRDGRNELPCQYLHGCLPIWYNGYFIQYL